MELKPCPFCGMNARAWSESQSWYVGCIGAFCAAQTKPFCEREEAIEAWNTREERTCELNGTISWEWNTTSTTFYTHSLSCGHNVTTTEPEPPCYCEECGAKVVAE